MPHMLEHGALCVLRPALAQDLKMISNAAGLPVPTQAFAVMADGLPCYVGKFPCYGNNRESEFIYLISNGEFSEFSAKTAKNSEEKILSLFFPCSAPGTA